MYIYRYINKHEQFGRVEYTLLLDDNDNIMPLMRIEKCFKIDSRLIDKEYLYQEAKKEIDRSIQEYKNIPIVEEEVE